MANIRRADPRFRESLGDSLLKGRIRDERTLVARSTVPIALLGASNDRFIDSSYYESLPMSRFWRSRVHMFEGNGHVLHMEAPERLASLLSEFANGASG